MEANLYYKILHKDGRIENYHLNSESGNIDFILDLVNDLRQLGNQIYFLKKNDYLREGYSKIGRINIHKDLNEPNDAQGQYLGFLEHYEI